MSVCSHFKRQLAELMALLHALEPHYVRCIKPNPGSKPLLLDEPYAGLDAAGAKLLDGVLADLGPERGAVMVTHEVERGVSLAGRAIVLRAGRVVLQEDLGGTDGQTFRRRYEELVA